MMAAGSIKEVWFHSTAVFESDCEEDFESVADGTTLVNILIVFHSYRRMCIKQGLNYEILSSCRCSSYLNTFPLTSGG